MYRELKGEFGVFTEEAVQRASKYIVLTGDDNVDYASLMSLELLRRNVQLGISNDKTKYSLPEAVKVKLQTQFNMRSLRNFLELRSAPSALWEIRQLANKIFEALPEDYKFLAEDVMYQNTKEVKALKEPAIINSLPQDFINKFKE